jgi:hypothetical protein
MIKVWTDLNTALFSSSFRLTEPKISSFSEIVSGMNCSALNAHLFIRNLVESPNCICGITETVSHFLLDCPRHTTLRQQLFFSHLDIPETISLKLLIFGSVNLNDEENKAVFKNVYKHVVESYTIYLKIIIQRD